MIRFLRSTGLLPLFVLLSACTGDGPTSTGPVTDPDDIEWDPASLLELVTFMDTTNASAFVLLHRGEVVAEHYPTNPDYRDLSEAQLASWEALRRPPTAGGYPVEDISEVDLSITALLVGIAVDRGVLNFDDPVSDHLPPGWSQAAPEEEAEVTLRHLLSMTSGLDSSRERVAAPGTVWGWTPALVTVVHDVLETATGSTLSSLTNEWIGEAMALEAADWVQGEGERASVGFATSARDLANLGQLILNRGSWDGDRIIEAATLNQLTSASQQLNPSFGLLWWINGPAQHIRPSGEEVKGSFVATAPDDMVIGLGDHDRFLAVIPSRQVVAVRLGPWYQGEGRFFSAFAEFFAMITASAPR